MPQIAILILSVFLLVNFCDVKDVIDMGADDLFNSIIGPVYKVKKTTHAFNINLLADMDSTTMSTPKIRVRFINEPDYFENSSGRFDTRHKKRRHKSRKSKAKEELDMEFLLDSPDGKAVPDFNVDPFKVLFRRFDAVPSTFKEYKAKPALREHYDLAQYIPLVKMEKRRILDIMQQFVYESRYKLVYAQTLRKKYKRRVAYQIGYCFALMRNMKQHQNVLMSAMELTKIEKIYLQFHNLFYFVKIYERIVRIDIDLKDMIKFITFLDFMMVHHNVSERPGR